MDNFEKMSSKKIKRKAKELFEEMDGVELVQEKGVDSRGHPIYEVKLSREGEVWTKEVKSPSSTGSSSNWLKRLKSKLRGNCSIYGKSPDPAVTVKVHCMVPGVALGSAATKNQSKIVEDN